MALQYIMRPGHPEEYVKKFDSIFEKVKNKLESAPGCHDFDHTLRVLRNAMTIADMEKISKHDWHIVELGALLHDVARPEEMASEGGICHAVEGAPIAGAMLAEAGFSEAICNAVAEAVKKHRFRGRLHPESLAEKIVYDADKLDSIGAAGIGRAFHFAGRTGARLHNTAEEALAGKEYGREDSAYREYLVKLRHVPERMLTASGRMLAVRRAEFMHSFFAELNFEVYGNPEL